MRSQRIWSQALVVTTSSMWSGIGGLGAHPVCEGVVVMQQCRVVAARREARRLCCRGGVEQAGDEGVELRCGGRRGHFDGGYRVATEQQMPTLTLKLNRTLNGELGGLLPPVEVADRVNAGEMSHSSAHSTSGASSGFEELAHCGLADSARTGDEQQHAREYGAACGRNGAFGRRLTGVRPRKRFTFFLTVKQFSSLQLSA